MKMNMKLVGIGLGLASTAAYFLMRKKKPALLTRREKYLRDAHTSGTTVNNEIVNYLKSNGTYNPGNLEEVIKYHGEDVPGRRYYQFYTKEAYPADEVILY